jgi:hypothetical protein
LYSKGIARLEEPVPLEPVQLLWELAFEVVGRVLAGTLVTAGGNAVEEDVVTELAEAEGSIDVAGLEAVEDSFAAVGS